MTTTSSGLRGEPIDSHSLLAADQRWISPPFQRRYVWGTYEIDKLWEDINQVLEYEEPVFMGALVTQIHDQGTTLNPKLVWLIDGQQRLTTLSLLILSCIELAQKKGWEDTASDLTIRYMFHTQSRVKDEPKLQPTFEDRKQFSHLWRKLQFPPAKNIGLAEIQDPEGNLVAGYNYCYGKMVAEFETRSEGTITEESLTRLLDLVLRNLQFVEIGLEDRHDVYTIYERLNVAGVKLEVIDLVRNIVFQKVGDTDNATIIYNEKWQPFEAAFTDPASPNSTSLRDGYFFPFGQTIHPSITKAGIYSTLKEFWDTDPEFKDLEATDKAEAIIEHLAKYKPAYDLITQGKTPNYSPESQIQQQLDRLVRMNVPNMIYSYLMQLLHAWMNRIDNIALDDCVNCINFIDSFLVRRALDGKEPTGIKALFQNMWQEAQFDTRKMLDKIERSSTQDFPNDDAFRESIRTGNLYNRKLCKYILQEQELGRSGLTNNVIHNNLQNITIDHIWPQSNAGSWATIFDGDTNIEYNNTWANLVPLSQEANSAKNADNWAKAREIYTRENIYKVTSDLVHTYENWNMSSLLQRASEIADWAITRWPHPSSY